MQQRDEYPRRDQTVVATPRAPPLSERGGMRCEEQPSFSPLGPHIPGWKLLARVGFSTGQVTSKPCVWLTGRRRRTEECKQTVLLAAEKGEAHGDEVETSQPARWTRWRKSSRAPEFQSQPVVTVRLVWPRPSVRVAVPEAGIHLKSDSSTWITTGFPYPAPEVCVRRGPTEGIWRLTAAT